MCMLQVPYKLCRGYGYGNERVEEDIVNKRESHDERERGTSKGNVGTRQGSIPHVGPRRLVLTDFFHQPTTRLPGTPAPGRTCFCAYGPARHPYGDRLP